MTQLPIMSGMVVRDGAFAASYPVNLEPRAIDSGLSKGQMINARGAVTVATGPGSDRGGINWNGTLYRVMGSKLVSVSSANAITVLGDVGTDGNPCGFDYSFDRLAVWSAGKLYYWNGTTLVQVTDPDLGTVVDATWMAGYFITTDGTSLVATDLTDPTSVNPLHYGSVEEDPDPVTGVMRYREELYAFGRYTIEVFQNVGGLNFPFQVIHGATIPYGCVSPRAKCMVAGVFAFVGGARGEPTGLFLFGGGGATRISNKDIEDLIANESDPSTIILEARRFGEETQVIMHLSTISVGLSLHTSAKADDAAWFTLQSDLFAPYRVRGAVYCYGQHYVGDTGSSALGVLSDTDPRHFGAAPQWRFDSALMYAGNAFIVNEIELIGQFPTEESVIFFSLTRDGVFWSEEIARVLTGQREERVVWRPCVRFPKHGSARWRGTGRVAIARAEMQADSLV